MFRRSGRVWSNLTKFRSCNSRQSARRRHPVTCFAIKTLSDHERERRKQETKLVVHRTVAMHSAHYLQRANARLSSAFGPSGMLPRNASTPFCTCCTIGTLIPLLRVLVLVARRPT